MKQILLYTAVVVRTWSLVGPATAGIIYVDDTQTTTNPPPDGSTWSNAFKYLQDAITAAQEGDTIRIAGGLYHPDDDDDIPQSQYTPGDRDASFVMRFGVVIRGGYGDLANPSNPDLRDTTTYVTILSGDLEDNDNPNEGLEHSSRGENSKSVVKGGDPSQDPLDGTSVLDGVTVTAGHGGIETFHDDPDGLTAAARSPNVVGSRTIWKWAAVALSVHGGVIAENPVNTLNGAGAGEIDP